MALRDDLSSRRDQIIAIAARYGVSNLHLFGSVLRDEERPDSDIDLLVDMAEDRGFRDYLGMIEELEDMFGCRIEVVLRRSLSPHFRPFIEAEARPL